MNTKHKKKKPKSSSSFQVVKFPEGGLFKTGEMGVYCRNYPNQAVRTSTIKRISRVPETQRSADDWWQLGEYQVFDGILNEDDSLINQGIDALMRGSLLNPPSIGCLMDLGWVMLHKGLDSMAIPYLERATALAPLSRDTWSMLAFAYVGVGNRDKAIAALTNASSLPEATEHDRNALASLAAGENLKVLRKEFVFQKVGVFELNDPRFDDQERVKISLILAKNMSEQHPDEPDYAYLYGQVRYQLGQYEQAEQLMQRVIGARPEHADALTMLALISKKTRNALDEAESFYRRAVAAEPEHVLANLNLGNLLQERGELHAARNHLKVALAIAEDSDPNRAIALDLMGSNIGMVEQDYEAEADYHRQAILLQPSRATFRANLIVALISLGRIKDAKRAFQEMQDKRLAVPNFELLRMVITHFSDEMKHPYEYLQLVDLLSGKMGWKAMRRPIELAWKRRRVLGGEEYIDFLSSIGMYASRAGAHDLALEVWEEGISTSDGALFLTNKAVELCNLRRYAEAIEIAESMPMTPPRSWTVLGNIRRGAKMYKAAIEAYREALDKDEKFLLPISNAIHSAEDGHLSEMLDPFLNRLEQDWKGNLAAELLRASGLRLQGELALAAKAYEHVLFTGGMLRTPEEIATLTQNPSDLSVSNGASIDDYYRYGLVLLELERFDELMALIDVVETWPAWTDGDWVILRAEGLRRANRFDVARGVVANMKLQSPTVLTRALTYRDEGNTAALVEAISLFEREIGNDDCIHPSGKPGAVFLALKAGIEIDSTNFEQGLAIARDAVIADPGSCECRVALARALESSGLAQEAIDVLSVGLKRLPGNPLLLSMLIDAHLSDENADAADAMVSQFRPLLERNGFLLDASRLGEQVSLAKLSLISTSAAPSSDSESAYSQWIEDRPEPINRWLKAATIARRRGDELRTAEVMYLGKVAEYVLLKSVFEPFKIEYGAAFDGYESKDFRDVANFVAREQHLSLGGMARILRAAERSYRSSEERLLTTFRDYITSGAIAEPKRIRDREFVELLSDFARLRNCAAHIQDPDEATHIKTMNLVVGENGPGILLQILGL